MPDAQSASLKNEKLILIREKGKRVKQLRLMAGLTSEDLAERVGVSRVAISYWENARYAGLTMSGAAKVIEAMRKENIACTMEWLWQGTGSVPHFIKDTESAAILSSTQFSSPSVVKEIDIFLKSDKDSVIVKIEDNHMRPIFESNDIVGGIWQPIESLKTDSYCIVALHSTNQVRWVKKVESSKSKQSTQISLVSPSISNKTKFDKVKLEKIARIIRVWR